MAKQHLITAQESPRKFFTMIPNLIDDMALDPYAFRLYVHLRRVAGEQGACWQSTRTLASACRMSTGKVSAAKKALLDEGLIILEKRAGDTGNYDHITIVDIWEENIQAYEATESVHVVNASASSVHVVNAKRSCGERKNNSQIIRTTEKEEHIYRSSKFEEVF